MVAYVPDDGVELLTGAVEAPHYGHGHEDLDTFDHFGNGTNVGAEGSMTTFDEYGHHYGGGHEQSDTFVSHPSTRGVTGSCQRVVRMLRMS